MQRLAVNSDYSLSYKDKILTVSSNELDLIRLKNRLISLIMAYHCGDNPIISDREADIICKLKASGAFNKSISNHLHITNLVLTDVSNNPCNCFTDTVTIRFKQSGMSRISEYDKS